MKFNHEKCIVNLEHNIKIGKIIRGQNYERTKDMTVAEKVAYYNNSGKEAVKEIERRKALERKTVASM